MFHAQSTRKDGWTSIWTSAWTVANSAPQMFRSLPHVTKLWLYMIIVFVHFSEHVLQMYQIYILGWMPKAAGGLLGLWLPRLSEIEVLHFGYNAFQLAGLLMLVAGVTGAARLPWKIAIATQSWHFFEHVLLQVQWATGVYLFGASQQMGIGQLWLPRPELHFLYNISVFVPTMIATVLYFRAHARQ